MFGVQTSTKLVRNIVQAFVQITYNNCAGNVQNVYKKQTHIMELDKQTDVCIRTCRVDITPSRVLPVAYRRLLSYFTDARLLVPGV